MVGTGGRAGSDEAKEREGDGDVGWFHRIMLLRLMEVSSRRKAEGGMAIHIVVAIKTGWGNAALRSR